MVFDWLHMPSEHGYNRMRHLSRFHARFPGGEGYYFPYAEALHSPLKERFREVVDGRRHGHKFWQDYYKGTQLCSRHSGLKLRRIVMLTHGGGENTDLFLSFVELCAQRGVEGPLGWAFRGDRPNRLTFMMDEFTGEVVPDPWAFNRNGHRNGSFHSLGGDYWLEERPTR